ncbi:MAG: hypothetical protein U0401_02445 [Anaerolineae bacterium]
MPTPEATPEWEMGVSHVFKPVSGLVVHGRHGRQWDHQGGRSRLGHCGL